MCVSVPVQWMVIATMLTISFEFERNNKEILRMYRLETLRNLLKGWFVAVDTFGLSKSSFRRLSWADSSKHTNYTKVRIVV